MRKRLAARALLKRWLLWIAEGFTPGKAEEGCGEGVGEAVTDMSSSGGDRGAEVVARPTWFGEFFGEVVL